MDKEDQMGSVETYPSSGKGSEGFTTCRQCKKDQELLGSSSNYLPQSEHMTAIFSTRLMDIGTSVAGSGIIELHEMDESKSKRFLEASLIPSRQAPS
jgi:hypothetical protein